MNFYYKTEYQMKNMKRLLRTVLLLSVFISTTQLVEAKKDKVTIFTIGDSTVKNGDGSGSNGLWGWGDMLQPYFDADKAVVKNHAKGGRSSRTFITEGLWQEVLDQLKPGDYVFIQFGHNDGGPMNTGRARASIKGVGNDSVEVIMEATGKPEVVYTYGHYIRRYINETKAKGAIPVYCSLIPRREWENGEIMWNHNHYWEYARQIADKEDVMFIDLHLIVAEKYNKLGEQYVFDNFFLEDHTHTTKSGAILNAQAVVEGLKAYKKCDLLKALSKKGKKLQAVEQCKF